MCQLRMLRTVGKILFFSCLVGIYIYFIYKLFTKSAFYSKDFNITIAGVAIIIAMQSSLVVALGMVGALSIVRFRTAIKNPLDLLYLFWAISAGIICGVSLYALAAALCIIMTVLIFVLNRLPNSKAPTLAIIRMDKECQIDNVTSILKKNSKGMQENSAMAKNGEREIVYELISPDADKIVDQMDKIEGIVSVQILRHAGEMRS